jgi:DNA-directed RNA polymerase subunit RPC12/RpoP
MDEMIRQSKQLACPNCSHMNQYPKGDDDGLTCEGCKEKVMDPRPPQKKDKAAKKTIQRRETDVIRSESVPSDDWDTEDGSTISVD